MRQKLHQKIENKLFNPAWEDGAFMDDVCAATLRGAHPAANLLFWCMALFIGLFVAWAMWAQVDEVTSGEGQVVPSGKIQTVQNLDGGYIDEILVKGGDIVEAGQVLVRIDDTGFASSKGEKDKGRLSLMADKARLEAELKGRKPVFPSEVVNKAPDALREANNLYLSRRDEMRATRDVLQQRIDQARQDLKDAESRELQTAESYQLAKQELDVTTPLERQGVVSKVELLRLQRQVAELQGEMSAARLAVPKARSAIREGQSQLKEASLRYESEVREQLSDVNRELAQLNESLKGDKARVDRTIIRSPIRAQVKQVLVNTIGGVVQPGMDLVELIPLDDSLLVEAKIRPSDIAFLRPGQEAQVKITAYDFSIYGGLDANLEQISADTVVEDQTSRNRGEAFYIIKVRTKKNFLGEAENPLPIISGMIATVDIKTGKKSVLDYLLKPFNKAREKALRER